MKKHLFSFFVVFVLLLSGITATAQNPTYSCKISNAVQVSCSMFEFDINIRQMGTTALYLSMFQAAISIDPSIIPAGATINVMPVTLPSPAPGYSQLSPYMVPSAAHFHWDSTTNCIMITPVSPSWANRTTITSNPAGTRICRVRVACSQPFLPGQTNPQWGLNSQATLGYSTKVFAYTGTPAFTNTEITMQASHGYVAPYNISLSNSIVNVPLARTITTDMTAVCANSGGATIAVTGTQAGLPYYLYKDSVPILTPGSVIFGNGQDIAFADLQTNGVFTVKVPSCSGMVDMQNSVTLTEMQPVVPSVTMSWINLGSDIKYTAHAINASPLWFTWYVNGIDQGIYDSTFTYMPQVGDAVYCCMNVDPASCITVTGQCIPSNTWTYNLFFHENFDLPSNADSVTASGAVNNFSLNCRLHYSGTHCDSAVVSTNGTAYLTTNSFSTVGYANIYLSFAHICKVDLHDRGIIEVSTDNGATWFTLDSARYINPGTSEFGVGQQNWFNAVTYSDWLAGTSFAKPDQSWWKKETFNLSDIAGNMPNVKVRFALVDYQSDGAFFNSGWYIDNIRIADSIGSGCTHTANLTPAGPVSACIGSSVHLTCNTVAGATYVWTQNGVVVPFNNTNSFYADSSGNYSVAVNANNCVVTSNVVSVNIQNFPPVPVITQTGSFNSCGGGSVTLSAPAGASIYQWSNGDTTQSISISASGNYSVGVGNSYGCITNSSNYVVTSTPMTNPDICMVSIDNASGHNMVIWDKPITTLIDHFNVYSEGSQTNVFNLLGSVNYSSVSEFIDTASNPLQQSYRYKISAADTCGTETSLSLYHKTIHLSINLGMGNTINLAWNQYEGFNFITYNIYRGTNASNMTLLTSLPNGSTSYTDLTPPSGLVYYQIEAVNPNPCTPSKTIYTGAKSNIATNDNIYVGVPSKESDNRIEIYPNPATNILNITGCANNTLAGVYDISGKLLLTVSIVSNQIDISCLAKGLYFIKLTTEEGSWVKKFVKE